MKRISMTAIALVALTGSVAAQAPFLLVPEADGAIACWKRSYEPAHLADHPDQLVTEMTFGASFVTVKKQPGMTVFGMAVTLRGDQSGLTSGQCMEGADGTMQCGVECDGGGVLVKGAGGGKLLIDLEHTGHIRMDGECAGGDDLASFDLEAGKDDRQFLLMPVEAKLCDGIIPRW